MDRLATAERLFVLPYLVQRDLHNRKVCDLQRHLRCRKAIVLGLSVCADLAQSGAQLELWLSSLHHAESDSDTVSA